MTMALFAIYGTMLAAIVGTIIVQVLRTTIERRKMQQAQDISQLRTSIASMTQTRFPAVYIRFDIVQKLGKMVPHETLRDLGQLTIIDTYDDLLSFTQAHVTVFISHQWCACLRVDHACACLWSLP